MNNSGLPRGDVRRGAAPLSQGLIHEAQLFLKNNKITQVPVYESIVSQLAHSLDIYRGRGYDVFDFNEAFECLTQAGYEFK